MYASYADLLCGLAVSNDPLVTQTDTTLSNLVVNAGGDFFDFAGGTPVVGDALCQAGYAHEIIDVTGSTLQIDVTGTNRKIVEGAAKILHSDVIPKARGESNILAAIEFIDLNTRQWFEPRAKTIRVEGKNSSTFFLPVPIISITEIRLNDDTTGTALSNFEVFNGVDNRRNPRVKIKSSTQSVFKELHNQVFIRAAYTEFDGSFGFVEADGSTPLLIQRATLMLAINYLKAPLGSGSSLAGVGALKREKVDLHETEYFQPDDVRGGASGAISGDIEVDRILKMYRGPSGIGSTILDLPRVEDYKRERFSDVVI